MSAAFTAAESGEGESVCATDPEEDGNGLVALDIETTGLGPLDTITCVCVCAAEWERTWVCDIDVEAVCSVLNRASRICAFNGATFDIPFMQRAWRLSDTQVALWMHKLIDPLYSVRGLFGTGMCEKLQSVLLRNGLEGKSGSGADAVRLAQEGRWDELAKYCAQDTRQTLLLIQKSINGSIEWNDHLQLRKGWEWKT